MGYENDPYRDENGEPLMDFDEDVHSDQDEHQQNLPDDDWGNTDRRERSPIPVYNESNPKPRKRLIKKSSSGKDSGPSDFGLDYDDGIGGDFGADDDDMAAMVRDDYSRAGKRKVDIGEKRKNVDKKSKGDRGEKKLKLRKSGGGRMRDHEADPEMKEMWDTVAGGNSEDDQEGNMTVDDNNFIDDTGVDPADRYGSDNAHSPSHAPQSSSRQQTTRPEAMSMDFLVRPQSKVDPDEVRARAKQQVQDQRRLKMNKKLQQLKAPKRKQLQATKLSVEGRGMVKYL